MKKKEDSYMDLIEDKRTQLVIETIAEKVASAYLDLEEELDDFSNVILHSMAVWRGVYEEWMAFYVIELPFYLSGKKSVCGLMSVIEDSDSEIMAGAFLDVFESIVCGDDDEETLPKDFYRDYAPAIEVRVAERPN